jgi:hypothetical protein
MMKYSQYLRLKALIKVASWSPAATAAGTFSKITRIPNIANFADSHTVQNVDKKQECILKLILQISFQLLEIVWLKMKIEVIFVKFVIESFTSENFCKIKIYKLKPKQINCLVKTGWILKLKNQVSNLHKFDRILKKIKKCTLMITRKFNWLKINTDKKWTK